MATKVLIERACCPFCSAPEMARLGYDKRGAPYIRCAGCGSVLFIKSQRVFDFFSHLMRNGLTLPAICADAVPQKVGVVHE